MTLQDRLRHGISLWQLAALSPIRVGEGRAVYRAESPEYGPVALKIHGDAREFRSEAAALAAGGKGCCRLYNTSHNFGLLLEEWISPGTPLRREQDPVRRMERFWEVFCRIHNAPLPEECGETYLDWLERADGFCQQSAAAGSLRAAMGSARRIGEELFAAYPQRVLLHGDLHHDNILLDQQNAYRAIDPKGVIGPPVFDMPRFLLNELGYADTAGAAGHMEAALRLAARVSGFPLRELCALVFMETVLANVWNVEDGMPASQETLRLAVRLLDHN